MRQLPLLQILALGWQSLSAPAQAQIRAYVESARGPRGGFVNRQGHDDIYYTLFGALLFEVIGLAMPKSLAAFLRQQKETGLTFPEQQALRLSKLLLYRHRPCRNFFNLLKLRWQTPPVADGQWLQKAKTYDLWLTQLYRQATGQRQVYPPAWRQRLGELQSASGGFDQPPTTPATAAGLLLAYDTGAGVNAAALRWLLANATGYGGFLAAPGAQPADLLSTGVALFALKILAQTPPQAARQREFITAHWLANGAFAASLVDNTGDVEYTFYGLLGLGALA